MITDMRRKYIQSPYFKVFLWIMIVVLGVVFTIPSIMRTDTAQWIAKVNSHTISYQDFVRKVGVQESILEVFRQRFGKQTDAFLQAIGRSNNPQELALDEVVRQTLLDQVVATMNIQVHENVIKGKLTDMAFVQQELADMIPLSVFDESGINMRRLQAYLAQSNISFGYFEGKVEEAIARVLLMESVSMQSYVPMFALKEQYARVYGAKAFDILVWSFDDFIKQARKTPVSDEQLKEFFEQQNARQQRYRVPEMRHGIAWTFDPSMYGVVVTNEEVEAYYDAVKSKKYLETPAQVQVRIIVLPVKDGNQKAALDKAHALKAELVASPSDFAKKAKELSIDQTAENGGLMPFFSKSNQEPALDRAAFTLSKDHDISDPIIMSKGVALVQRVAHKKPVFMPLSKVKDQIKHDLSEERFSAVFAADVKNIMGQASDDQALLQFVASKQGKKEVYSKVNREDRGKNKQVLFELNERDNRLTFFVENSRGVVVQLTKVERAYVPEFQAIKETVKDDYYRFQAATLASTAVEAAQQETGSNSEEPAFKAKVKHVSLISKKDTGRLSDLRMEGLPIDKMLQLEKAGSSMIHGTAEHVYLIRVSEVAPLDEQAFEGKKEEILKNLTSESEHLVIGSFVASLFRNATIELNESLLQS